MTHTVHVQCTCSCRVLQLLYYNLVHYVKLCVSHSLDMCTLVLTVSEASALLGTDALRGVSGVTATGEAGGHQTSRPREAAAETELLCGVNGQLGQEPNLHCERDSSSTLLHVVWVQCGCSV